MKTNKRHFIFAGHLGKKLGLTEETPLCEYHNYCNVRQFKEYKICNEIDMNKCQVRKFWEKYGNDYEQMFIGSKI